MAEVTLVMEHIYEGGAVPTIEEAGERAYRLMVGDEPLSGRIHQRKADAEAILDMAGVNEDSAIEDSAVEELQPPQDPAPEIPSEKPEPEVAANGAET